MSKIHHKPTASSRAKICWNGFCTGLNLKCDGRFVNQKLIGLFVKTKHSFAARFRHCTIFPKDCECVFVQHKHVLVAILECPTPYDPTPSLVLPGANVRHHADHVKFLVSHRLLFLARVVEARCLCNVVLVQKEKRNRKKKN